MEEVDFPDLNVKQIDTIDVATLRSEEYGKRASVLFSDDRGEKETCLIIRAHIESTTDLIGPSKAKSTSEVTPIKDASKNLR